MAHEAVRQMGRVRRVTGCRYACIGCGWRGPAHEARGHEAGCAQPARSAADLVPLLAERARLAQDAAAVHEQILDLLSYEKIAINGELLARFIALLNLYKLLKEKFAALDKRIALVIK